MRSSGWSNGWGLDGGQCRTRRWLILGGVCAPLLLVGPAPGADTAPAPQVWPIDHAAAPSTPAAKDASQFKNMSLEDLMKVEVTTVSQVSERIDLAPGNVYSYSRETIKDRGYRSLGELLQVVPGFAVFHRDLDFTVGFRGLGGNDNDKVSLLINGQNVNGPNEFDFLNGPINLDNVERVEIVGGPSAFFQQANTLAATVNVITKDVEGAELITSAGNDLHYATTLMAGHHWGPDEFLSFSGTTMDEKGFDAWGPDAGLGQPGQHSTGALDQPDYFSILHGKYGEVSGQFIAYRSTWPELHIDNGSPTNDGHMAEQFYTLYLKDEHPWTSSLMSVATVEASYKSQTRSNDSDTSVQNAEQQWVNQWFYRTELGVQYTGIEHNLIQAGVQASFSQNDVTAAYSQSSGAGIPPNYVFPTSGPYFDPATGGMVIPRMALTEADVFAVGLYVDDEFQVTDKLKLVGGVRMDRNTELAPDRWFPGARASIIYEATQWWVSKLNYNRAVKFPSVYASTNQLWGTNHPLAGSAPPPAAVFGPPNVPFAIDSPTASQPEVLSTIEWDNILYIEKARVGLNLFHQEDQNYTSWFGPHANGGNARGEGVELTLQAPLTDRLTIWANGALNDTRLDLFNSNLAGLAERTGNGTEAIHSYTNSEDFAVGAPRATANLGFDYQFIRNVTISPAVRYITDQAAVGVSPNGTAFEETIRNRYYLDATLTWANIVRNHLDMQFSVYNILNNREPVGSPADGNTYHPRGTSFVVSMDWRF